MKMRPRDIVEQAIRRKAGVRLTVSVCTIEHLYEARLIGPSAPPEPQGVWAQLTKGEPAILETIIRSQAPMHGSVYLDGVGIGFDTRLLMRNKHYWIEDRLMIDGLLLEPVRDIEIIQNRQEQRFAVRDSGGISATLFRINAGGAAAAMTAKLWDLGAGGASFICPVHRKLLAIGPEERFLAQFNFRGATIQREGKLVYQRTLAGKAIRLGIEFDPSAPCNSENATEMEQLMELLERLNRVRPSLSGVG
jgi:hypothetical protein